MNNDHLDDFIRRKTQALDDFYPDSLEPADQLWLEILNRRKQKHRRSLRVQWSIAATVLLLMMAGVFWRVSITRDAHDHGLTLPELVSTREHEALEYIKKFCGEGNILCNSPAFKELQNELKESSLSLMEIDKQITLFGTDANLLRAKTRIENHQANIIRAMVQTL
jgi:hypothetical protein